MSKGLWIVCGIDRAGKTLLGKKQEHNKIRHVLLRRLTACHSSQGRYFDERRISMFVDSSSNRGQ